jgi:dihydropteroate synthase
MYGSIEEPTVWAEWSHATDGGVAPADDPRWLCVFDADLRVMDLRRDEVREALDVTIADLNADWASGAPNPACLKVIAAAAVAGAEAMIVPSAARPGAWNLDVLPRGFPGLRRVRRRRTIPKLPTP